MKKLNKLWLKYQSWTKANLTNQKKKSALITLFLIFILYLVFTAGTLKNKYGELIGSCNVQGINLHGQITTYIPEHNITETSPYFDSVASEKILWLIEDANENPNIKAIVIEVDSGGGSPVAGEEVSNAIQQSNKPVIAFIRSIGASASYLSISSADKIFASKYSDVGGIGVTMSYLNNVNKNKKDGYTYEELSIGKFKDSGSPDKILTTEEKILFQRDLKIIYEDFIETISKNRNIPINEVKDFADGSTVLGTQAKELGLINEIGGIFEVKKYLKEITGEESEICWE